MVKVSTGPMGTQASTVASTMSERVSALNNAITQLSTFAGETSLQGAAYDSAKNFGTAVLTPMLQGMILFSEGVSERVTELQTLYASICGGEDLDSDILQAKIDSDTASLKAAQKLLDALVKDEGSSKAQRDAQMSNIKALKKRIKSNQKKLDNLNKFNSQSESVFRDIQNTELTVTQAISAITTSFSGYDSKTGAFGNLSRDQLAWTETVKSDWEAREDLKKDYKEVLSKIKNGESLNQKDAETLSSYAKKHPDVKVPKYVISYFENNSLIKGTKSTLSSVKTYGSLTRNLVIASRIQTKGNAVIMNHGSTNVDILINKAFNLEKEFDANRVSKGYNYSYITGDNGSNVNGNYKDFAEKYGFSSKGQLYNGGKTDLKGFTESAKNATKSGFKSGLKSGVTLGVSDAVDAFKTGGDVAKGVAILNVASTAIDVKNGMDVTQNMAINKGIKKGSSDYFEAQTGGVAIDIAKGAAIGAVSAAAGSAAVAAVGAATVVALPAAAVVAITVGAGFLVTKGLNTLDEKFNLTQKAKNWWIDTIKN